MKVSYEDEGVWGEGLDCVDMGVGPFIVIAGDYNFGTLNNESEDCPTLSLALIVVADIFSDKDKIIRTLFYLCFIYIKSRTNSIQFISLDLSA